MLASAVAVLFFLQPDSLDQFPWFVVTMLSLFMFAGVGNASTFKQMPMIFPPRQAGGVIGWTAAIAAYGPFVFSVLIGVVIGATGYASGFFVGLAAFIAANVVINWWFYTRRGAERPC
jgi:NNP family nitrate/nitrite transporter-like MFS transporter